jgi:hypothetical protein
MEVTEVMMEMVGMVVMVVMVVMVEMVATGQLTYPHYLGHNIQLRSE